MSLIFSADPYEMEWLREDFPYAEVRLPSGDDVNADAFAATSETTRDGDVLRTAITITNVSHKPCSTAAGDVAITLPLQDRYDGTGEGCATKRCHVHLHCDGESTTVLALRMGGEAPHLGMVLTEGSIVDYSIERDLAHLSNDRGCFLLHPAPVLLAPGESVRVAWTIFPCTGREDFPDAAAEHAPVLTVRADRLVLTPGESTTVQVTPSLSVPEVLIDGEPAQADGTGTFTSTLTPQGLGEHEVEVRAGDRTAHVRLLVIDPLADLVAARIVYLLERQQYDGPIASLRGAFLAYDTEEEHLHFSPLADHNAARERIGMAHLIAVALEAQREGVLDLDADLIAAMTAGLERYRVFAERELVDLDTGEVFDDIGHDPGIHRLYNFPWFAAFFCQLHRLGSPGGGVDPLELAVRIVRCYYRDGGARFYPIEMPMTRLVAELAAAGRREEAEELRGLFVDHARTIARAGRDYPAHEVNYEQSIVGPAADITLQGYELSGDPSLLEAARLQRAVLEQFNGRAPDHRLFEVAIRHWDGYWFGKRRLYGDTFPHYWSAITGTVLARWGRVLEADRDAARHAGELAEVRARAEASLRGVLPMIRSDGAASCAHMMPLRVNGIPARGADPLANDQDWALVFSLRDLLDQRDHGGRDREAGEMTMVRPSGADEQGLPGGAV